MIRTCSKCETEIFYKNAKSYRRAVKDNSKCKKCSQIGKQFSEETKEKMKKNAPDRSGENNPNFGKISVLNGKKWEEFRSNESIKFGKEKLSSGLFSGHKHSKESKNKIRLKSSGTENGFYGKTHTEETKTILREKTLKMHEEKRTKTSNTSIEIKMEEILKNLSIEYIHQKKFGFWSFDFYLPMYDMFIECDGDYWHANPIIYKDSNAINETQKKNVMIGKRKNEYTKEKGKILLRFWESDINHNPNMIISKLKETINDKSRSI